VKACSAACRIESKLGALAVLATGKKETSMADIRSIALYAATALTLFAGAGTALAQTAKPVVEGTVPTPAPLQMTPEQRQTAYRTIVRERAVPPAKTNVEYSVGARIPDGTHLYPVPQEAAAAMPAIGSYKYLRVNGEVLLVDPATSHVVAELAD
jgi:hypothetical protein